MPKKTLRRRKGASFRDVSRPRRKKRQNKRRVETRNRARRVLARIRNRGESLSYAARAEHTTPRTVRKEVGKQLKRDASGRYSATRGDTLRRDLNVLSYDGYVPVTVHSSSWQNSRRSISLQLADS